MPGNPSNSSKFNRQIVYTVDAGAKTASFNTTPVTNNEFSAGTITMLFGTVSGTVPTLTAQLQYSPDGGTTWISLGAASTAITATGNSVLIAIGTGLLALVSGATQIISVGTRLPILWRIACVIGGTTPSFALTSVCVDYLV